MTPRSRTLLTIAFLLAAALPLTACSAPSPEPTTPAPSLTVVVVTPAAASGGFLEQAITSTTAVATSLGATVEVLESENADSLHTNVETAIAAAPDLIIGLTDEVLYEFDPAAASNLEQQFLLVDTSAAEPTSNLTSIVFRDYEATYLTGVEASLIAGADDSAIGIVAPEQDALVQSWTDLFSDGAQQVSRTASPAIGYIGGELPTADSAGAATTAAALAADGAHVIQSVELAPGVDLLAAASDNGFSTFGSQVNQCDLAPGHVVDSTIKRVDVALEATLPRVLDGDTGGVYSFGLAEGGVTLASLDDGAAESGCLIVDEPELLAQVTDARDRIVSGETLVGDPLYAQPIPELG